VNEKLLLDSVFKENRDVVNVCACGKTFITTVPISMCKKCRTKQEQIKRELRRLTQENMQKEVTTEADIETIQKLVDAWEEI